MGFFKNLYRNYVNATAEDLFFRREMHEEDRLKTMGTFGFEGAKIDAECYRLNGMTLHEKMLKELRETRAERFEEYKKKHFI